MTCEELRPEYGAWALGIAEEPERSEIAQHLERDCPNCVPGVRSAIATVSAMASAIKPVDPPARLRKRVVSMVAPEPERSRASIFFPWAVAGAFAIALLAVVIPGRLARTPAPPVASNTGQAKFEEVLSILNDPVTKDVAFGDPSARGRFFVSPTKGVVFIAAHLPTLSPGRTFQMWVIPNGGNPISAGTFQALSDSTAVHYRPGPVENAAAMAISVEPSGGSPQPTTTPIIVTKL